MSDARADGAVTATRDGHVLIARINRPAKLNGFTPKMMRELAEAYTTLETDAALRAAVVLAEGPHFSAGLDLPKFAALLADGAPLVPEGLVDPFDLRAPRRTKPVVVGTRGISFTLAVELSLASDVAVAADDVRMNQIEVQRAIMASGGATVRLVERAGWAAAMRWLLTGDEWGADRALAMGVVSEIVAPKALDATCLEIARRIAAAAPGAVLATRANALMALEGGRAAAIAEFDAINRGLAASADAAEGLAAFRERRPPRFEGR